MANEEQLKIILFRGVEAWNVYRANASDLTVDLSGADLGNIQLVGVHLNGANLREANFSRTNFGSARLDGADLSSAVGQGATFNEADLNGANFDNADLVSANFDEARLQGARFVAAKLGTARFNNADLTGADFSGADLRNAILTGATLANANLSGAYLAGAKLQKSNLFEANLTGANLSDSNFVAAKTIAAVFKDARINKTTTGLHDLTQEQFDSLRLIDPGVRDPNIAPGEPETAVTLQGPEMAAASEGTGAATASDLPRRMVSFSASVAPGTMLNSVFLPLTSSNDIPALDLVLEAIELEEIEVLDGDTDENAFRDFVHEALLRMARQLQLPDAETTATEALAVLEETMVVVCQSPAEGMSLKMVARLSGGAGLGIATFWSGAPWTFLACVLGGIVVMRIIDPAAVAVGERLKQEITEADLIELWRRITRKLNPSAGED